MLGNLLFLLVMTACGLFMASRVYLLVSRKKLNVEGVVYSWTETPFQYCLTLIFAVLGTAFTLGLALLAVRAIVEGW